MDYTELPIFRDISGENIERMLHCFSVRQENFSSGDLIRDYDGTGRDVGILLSGAVELVRIDQGGNRTILERLDAGGLFGEALAFSDLSGDCTSVICTQDCQVMFMEYRHIVRRCENACAHHSQLVHNVLGLLTEQNLRLSRRVEILSRRSIREKLLCYFAIQAGKDSSSFTMPFTLSALADYISTDRSAMMRELRKLREEGVVTIQGRQVTLNN